MSVFHGGRSFLNVTIDVPEHKSWFEVGISLALTASVVVHSPHLSDMGIWCESRGARPLG